MIVKFCRLQPPSQTHRAAAPAEQAGERVSVWGADTVMGLTALLAQYG